MASSDEPTWWVIYQEPEPTTMELHAVELEPADEKVRDKWRSDLTNAGKHISVVNAPDIDAAINIAYAKWLGERISNLRRQALADASDAAHPNTL
ncbi:hypothetical protein [Streptomyces sp. NPDC127084]|uniref:hypothetical protein n=1 Tax=Streptomyces sp. NPDC127084 TaxID=3347133 RepID=UPI00364C7DB0